MLPPRKRFKSSFQRSRIPTLVGTQQESVTDFRSNQSENGEATIAKTDISYSQVGDDNDTDPDEGRVRRESLDYKAKKAARRSTPEYKAQQADRQSTPEYKAQKAAYDKARRSTEEYKLWRSTPEYKAQQADRQSTPEYKAQKAARDKARRSTEEYKLQARLEARRKAECQRAEEALRPALAEERKKKARPKLAIYYQSNKEKLAALRSTPEMKAKKAAYDKARKDKHRGIDRIA